MRHLTAPNRRRLGGVPPIAVLPAGAALQLPVRRQVACELLRVLGEANYGRQLAIEVCIQLEGDQIPFARQASEGLEERASSATELLRLDEADDLAITRDLPAIQSTARRRRHKSHRRLSTHAPSLHLATDIWAVSWRFVGGPTRQVVECVVTRTRGVG